MLLGGSHTGVSLAMAPAESKGPWDYYKLVKTMSGEEAYGSLSDSTCPLVKKQRAKARVKPISCS
jgi:hypothetical protein